MSWDTLTQDKLSGPELDRLYFKTFNTEAGRKVLKHLRSKTIEQPSWFPGEDPSHGFAREGQNSIIRDIELRMKRSKEN